VQLENMDEAGIGIMHVVLYSGFSTSTVHFQKKLYGFKGNRLGMISCYAN